MNSSRFSRTCAAALVGASLVGMSFTGATAAFAAPVTHSIISEHHSGFTASDIWAKARSHYPSELTRDGSFVPGNASFAAVIQAHGGQAALFSDPVEGRSVGLAFGHGDWNKHEKVLRAHGTAVVMGHGVPATARVYSLNGGGTFTGEYDMFYDGYWVSITSSRFTSPHEAAPLLAAAAAEINAQHTGKA